MIMIKDLKKVKRPQESCNYYEQESNESALSDCEPRAKKVGYIAITYIQILIMIMLLHFYYYS